MTEKVLESLSESYEIKKLEEGGRNTIYILLAQLTDYLTLKQGTINLSNREEKSNEKYAYVSSVTSLSANDKASYDASYKRY